MKRSSRLIMLLGIILAGVAFLLVLFMSGQRPTTTPPGGTPTAQEIDVVTVVNDVALGDTLTADNLTTTKIAATDPLAVGAFRDPLEVEGAVVRRDISAGQVLQQGDFSTQRTATNLDIVRSLDQGLRAMAIEVDQTTGVGTLVQPGDRVDVIAAVSDSDTKYPQVFPKGEPTPNEVPWAKIPDEFYNGTSVKLVVQNVQVLGTLLPPPPEDTGQEQPAEGEQANEQGTALTGQKQIVILAVLPQQAEIIRFTQLDGNLSIVLRSPDDKESAPDATTGITLAELFTDYGVIKPELFEVIEPAR